jgi:hypothetical protein
MAFSLFLFFIQITLGVSRGADGAPLALQAA